MSEYDHARFKGLKMETVNRIKKVDKKVARKMKDEQKGIVPLEFVRLRSKFYSILVQDRCAL